MSRGLVCAVTLATLVLAGCGSHPRNDAPSAASVDAAFKGSPGPLAALHAKANQLVGGGPSAFKATLGSVKGYPIVVNKWASWCGPCQTEFPSFQQAAVKYGKQVAFLGIDGKDHDAAAAAFLKRFPVTYPSYTDPQEAIASDYQAATYFPQTLYFNRQGKLVYDHAGPYLSAKALEQDVRRYALGSG
jgi:cytochrome c biogenesis protein CcmG/thiol:disulfide interchange protein DsbE